MPTMGAIGAEIAPMPGLLSLIGRFDKCALVSGTAWLRTAAEIEGYGPGLQIKSFTPDAVDAAEAWLADNDEGSIEDVENFPVWTRRQRVGCTGFGSWRIVETGVAGHGGTLRGPESAVSAIVLYRS